MRSRRPATGVGPEVSPECPRERPPKNGGCPRECPTGCLRGPSGPGLRSVQKVSRECPECQKGVPATPGTLSGHFLDSPEPGARRAPETPRRTLPRTPPVFRGHSRRHSGDTSGPRDSCSRPAGSQPKCPKMCTFRLLGSFGGLFCGAPTPKDPAALKTLRDGELLRCECFSYVPPVFATL